MKSEDEIDEQIAVMKQQAEQAGAAFKEVANMLGSFRAGLIEQGFTIDEIVPLCITQLNLWWTSIMAENQKDND